jgi:integrase
MSTQNASRPANPTSPSLADLLAVIAADNNLSERKRQELASAIRTVARALGRPPENIPTDAWLLANRLQEVAPAAIGLSRGRWNNVRSLFRCALARFQQMSPGRHRNDLLPQWLLLSKKLASRSDKIALSRVLHFFSARAIGPEAVTESSFEEFRFDLDHSLRKTPARTFASTVRAWRRAVMAVEGWPQVSVSIPNRRRQWIFGWDRFPGSLRQDCQAWCDRLAGRDLMEDAPCRPVRPVTVAHRDWQIRAFATALALKGRDPATLTSLGDLVEIEAFKTGLRFFLDREGGKPTTAIADLASSLKAIARHHVRVETQHLDLMGSIIRRLASGRHGLTEVNRKRLRPFDDRRNIEALLTLPAKLMREAAKCRNPHRAAVRAQLAAAIEILTMAPLRMRNLVNLDLERNLVRPGQSRALYIVIGASEVKNQEPLEYPLPPESVDLIERYIREFRPRLTSSANTALFPGRGGGPKSESFLGAQISKTILDHTGLQVHPHLFRHIAAKLHLDCSPGDYETVRRVLAHRSIDTTIGFYVGAEATAAVRHFDETILQLRRNTKVESDKKPKMMNRSELRR